MLAFTEWNIMKSASLLLATVWLLGMLTVIVGIGTAWMVLVVVFSESYMVCYGVPVLTAISLYRVANFSADQLL